MGRVDKHNGSRRTIILEQLPDLMGIKAVNMSAVEGLLRAHSVSDAAFLLVVCVASFPTFIRSIKRLVSPVTTISK